MPRLKILIINIVALLSLLILFLGFSYMEENKPKADDPIEIPEPKPAIDSDLITLLKFINTKNIQFDSGSAELFDDDKELLYNLAGILNKPENLELSIKIEGHTDDVGNDQRNLKLSQARADSIRDFLAFEAYLNSQRIKSIGYGETKPLIKDTTPEAREKNRRVEFHLK